MTHTREIAVEQVFNSVGEWQAFQAAELWVEELHYSRGSIGREGEPVGIVSNFRSDFQHVPEWSDMSEQERNSLDGQMTGNFRDGPVTVQIFKR